MSGVQTIGWNVCHVDSQARIAGRGVLGRLPAIAAPMDHRRRLHRNAQCFSGRHNSALVVEPPFPETGLAFLYPVALYGLRRLIENLAVPQRTDQLDVLRMRPHQRTSRPRRLAQEKLTLSN